MITHITSKSWPAQSSQFYRCPGCNELVDGDQLSEVLVHHQHVLDSYRLRIMRDSTLRGQAQHKGRRKADRR